MIADFTQIDEHAVRRLPVLCRRSLDAVADHLIGPARNDAERARAIFRWIAVNVSYDTGAFFSGRYPAQSAENVLKTGVAVCAGYSTLFQALAERAGLESRIVSGIAKGYGYSLGQGLPEKPNHDWNAVRVEGCWRLIDCTWGAGHLGDSSQYVRELDNHFFLTPPAQLIYSHFPEDPELQLLRCSVSRDEFEQLPILKSHFFSYGLGLDSDRLNQGLISCDGVHRIRVEAPGGIVLDGYLEQGSKRLSSHSFAQRRDNWCEIDIACPQAGKYALSLYVRHNMESISRCAARFLVEARLPARGVTFPERFSAFSDCSARLLQPCAGRLPAGTQQFQLVVPAATDVAVINRGKWAHLEESGGVFRGSCNLEKGEAQLAAQLDGKDQYSVLLRYDVG